MAEQSSMAHDVMGQDEIERLLSQAQPLAPSAPPDAAAPEGHELPPPAEGKVADPAADRPLPAAATPPDPAAPAPSAAESSPRPAGDGSLAPGDIEFLLNQAEQALESINAASSGDLPRGVASYRLEEFTGSAASTENATLDLIRDVELDLKIELGRTNMFLEDVLKLRKGAVVPLDKLAGDPVDVYVNGRLIARGEVLVLNDNFCVRVAELIAGANVFS
ncbi:MAG: flagellar motor switch protein FliN [Thermoguttaceae bacterium]